MSRKRHETASGFGFINGRQKVQRNPVVGSFVPIRRSASCVGKFKQLGAQSGRREKQANRIRLGEVRGRVNTFLGGNCISRAKSPNLPVSAMWSKLPACSWKIPCKLAACPTGTNFVEQAANLLVENSGQASSLPHRAAHEKPGKSGICPTVNPSATSLAVCRSASRRVRTG